MDLFESVLSHMEKVGVLLSLKAQPHSHIRFLLHLIVNINLNVSAVLGNTGDLLTFSQALDSLLASEDDWCGQHIHPLLSSFS